VGRNGVLSKKKKKGGGERKAGVKSSWKKGKQFQRMEGTSTEILGKKRVTRKQPREPNDTKRKKKDKVHSGRGKGYHWEKKCRVT